MKMESGQRAVDKIHKRRDRYEIPDWQRGRVWGTLRKQLLIDSILRGWKLPKFYFLKSSDDPESFEVVDGQQRLNAIFDFFTGDLRLSKESAQEFGGEYYKDLPSSLSDAFDDFEIEFDVVVDAEEAEVKQFFQRLQRGLSLTGSEQLNAVPSNLRDFVLKLSKHTFFQNKVTASDTRYGFFDIVSKVAAIEIEGIDAGLRFDDLKATFDGQANFSENSKVAMRLQGTFDRSRPRSAVKTKRCSLRGEEEKTTERRPAPWRKEYPLAPGLNRPSRSWSRMGTGIRAGSPNWAGSALS